MEKITREFKTFLEGLENKALKEFIKEFEELESYNAREEFLNKFVCLDFIPIFENEEFIKLFNVRTQGEYLNNKFKKLSFDKWETLVYCYNSNSREFKEKNEEKELKKEMLKEGFILIEDFSDKGKLQNLNGLKVYCVFDRDKIGLMGSFSNTEQHEGSLIYQEEQGRLCFLPKRHRTTGQILYKRFFYRLKGGIN